MSGADIADGTNVDLAAGKEGYRTAEIDGEAALHAAEYHAIDSLVLAVGLFEPSPGFLAARLVAREHRFAEGVFDALEIDFDLIAGL